MRDYTYDKAYAAKPDQKKRRAQRNAARRKMEKAGRVSKGDGNDVDHISSSKKGSLSNKPSNLRVVSSSKNRARK